MPPPGHSTQAQVTPRSTITYALISETASPLRQYTPAVYVHLSMPPLHLRRQKLHCSVFRTSLGNAPTLSSNLNRTLAGCGHRQLRSSLHHRDYLRSLAKDMMSLCCSLCTSSNLYQICSWEGLVVGNCCCNTTNRVSDPGSGQNKGLGQNHGQLQNPDAFQLLLLDRPPVGL